MSQNEYLALREAKIQRNNERLQELGLVRNNHDVSSAAASVFVTSSSGASRTKNTKKRVSPNDIESQSIVPRRSLRTRTSLSDVAVNDDNNVVEQKIMNKNVEKENKSRKRTLETSTSNHKQTDLHIIKPQNESIAKPGTTRATLIDVSKVLYGNFNYPIYIGRQLATTGKASVIDHAALVCRINDKNPISFNKYSGVCEFKNDSIFLWVNIGSPDADVTNEFFTSSSSTNSASTTTANSTCPASSDFISQHTSMHMSWYGGSKMKADSPSIQKLVYIGQKASRNELLPTDGIVLWCRLYNKSKKSFEPYACLGRLSYVDHDPNVQPIKFVWNLMDYNILVGNDRNDDQEGSIFQRILNTL